MTRQRVTLYLLLSVVAASAAVLSFAALEGLAETCGFSPTLSPLLPLVVDAGAAAGSIVWLANWVQPAATAYGRALALLLLGSSVGGNALGHYLAAYDLRPHWTVVVGVSAIAPATLGALAHLLVLVGRPPKKEPLDEESTEQSTAGETGDDEFVLPDRRDAIDTSSIPAIVDDLRAIAVEAGRSLTQDEVRTIYGVGADKAGKVRRLLGWWPRAVEQSDQAEVLAR